MDRVLGVKKGTGGFFFGCDIVEWMLRVSLSNRGMFQFDGVLSIRTPVDWSKIHLPVEFFTEDGGALIGHVFIDSSEYSVETGVNYTVRFYGNRGLRKRDANGVETPLISEELATSLVMNILFGIEE